MAKSREHGQGFGTGNLSLLRTVLHKMERFDEALFHFQAAEQIYVPGRAYLSFWGLEMSGEIVWT